MGRYYAGHWETTLAISLTWHRSLDYPGKVRPQTPETWRAPSWFWASIDGKAIFSHLEGSIPKLLVTILNVMTSPVGDDPMGLISSASLALVGQCLYATLETHWEEESDGYSCCVRTSPRAYSTVGSICLRNFEFTTGYKDDGMLYSIRPELHGLIFDYDLLSAGPYHVPNGSKILIMKYDETVSEGRKIRNWLMFREIDRKNRVCERIGLIRLWHENKVTRKMNRSFEEDSIEMKVTVV